MKGKTVWILTAAILLLLWPPASARVLVTGDFGTDVELLSYVDADDEYSEVLLVDDGVLVAMGREEMEAGKNDSLDAAVACLSPGAEDVQVLAMEPVCGYMAERACFQRETDGDVHVVNYVYIPEEESVFYVEISVPSAWMVEYAPRIEAWIQSIDLFDDGMNHGFTPEGMGSPVIALVKDDPAPPDWTDVEQYAMLLQYSGAETVEDLVEMFAPVWFSWTIEEDGALLTLDCDSGSVTVVPEEWTGLDPSEGEKGAPELPAVVLEAGCALRQICWSDEAFPLYPLRGLGVGERMQAVLEAYAGGERCAIPEKEADFDEQIAYAVPVEGAEEEFVFLIYYGREGQVARIELSTDGLPAGNEF